MSIVFERQLLRQLKKNMQEEISYSPSMRIEGMLQQNVNDVAPDRAAMVIDADLSQEDFKQISDSIRHALHKDYDFKETAFAIFVWENQTFAKIKLQASNFIKARFLDKVFEQIDIGSGSSSDWNNFKELDGNIKKAPLKIIVTTDIKVCELEKSDYKGRNTIVCYSTNDESAAPKKIRNMVCIPFIKANNVNV